MLSSKLNFPRLAERWHQLIRLLLGQQLVISLKVKGEGTSIDLLAAYAQGVRYFPYSNLCQAQLFQTKLPGIMLVGAKLSNIDFWEADLRGGDFSCADLRGANQYYANRRFARQRLQD